MGENIWKTICKWKANINIYSREIGFEEVNSIELVKDGVQ
jgi:hypothetical protein